MPFKINISHKGKTLKIETESEVIVGKKIGEIIKGEDISNELDGYEVEVTGTSDKAGFPGFKGLEGTAYHRKLLTYGPGMKDRRKGIRLRKNLRGEEISLKISQINTKVIKEGNKRFEEIIPKKESEEAPAEEKKEPAESEQPSEQPKERKKEETKQETSKEESVKETKEKKEEEANQHL